jgi:hypothetical protein
MISNSNKIRIRKMNEARFSESFGFACSQN